jgi:hypothetical protein
MCKPDETHTINPLSLGNTSLLLSLLISKVEEAAAALAQEKSKATSFALSAGQQGLTSSEPVMLRAGVSSPLIDGALCPKDRSGLRRAAATAATSKIMTYASPNNVVSASSDRDSSNDECSKTTDRPRRRKRKARNHYGECESTDTGHRRVYVNHNYHDYAGCPNRVLNEVYTLESIEARKSRGGTSTPFPKVLHRMLDQAEVDGFSEIVSWQPHGRAFLVHDQARFVAEVMPRFFRQTRFSSFQRQLSLYGFLRLTRKGADHNAYYHELCLRGMPELLAQMQRTRIKGYWVRQSSSPESEPDFYSMPTVEESIENRPLQSDSTQALSSDNVIIDGNDSLEPIPVNPVSNLGVSRAPSFGKLEPGQFAAYGGCMKLPPMPPLRDGPLWSSAAYLKEFPVDEDMSISIDAFIDSIAPHASNPSDTAVLEPLPAYSSTSDMREDLVNFLSNVDLSSEDGDNSEFYRNEEHLERLHSSKQAQNGMEM